MAIKSRIVKFPVVVLAFVALCGASLIGIFTDITRKIHIFIL